MPKPESEWLTKKHLKELVSDQCRQVMLSNGTVAEILAGSTLGQLEYLSSILSHELSLREQSRRARYIKKASFPVLKTFDGYDFSGITFPALLGKEEMLSLDFIRQKKVLVWYGGCGSGKTHAMTALGVMACNSDYKVKFTTVGQLVSRLSEAKYDGSLERVFTDLERIDLLCLDELCYIPIDRESAQLLFRVISESYERKAMMITTNLPFNEWGKYFTDEQLAAAIIDRIVHYGHLINTGDRDWRLEHSLMRDRADQAESGRRISGQ